MGRIVEYAKHISRYFSASLIPMVLNLAINPLVSLAMDPEDFAITGYFTSFNALISPIILYYLLHYYNKCYFELDDTKREHLRVLLFKLLIFFSFFIALLLTVVLALYIHSQSAIHYRIFPYLLLVVFAIPLSGIYNLQLADYKMQRDSSRFLKLSVSKGLLGVLGTLLFVVLLRMGALGKLLAPFLVEVLFFLYLLIRNRNYWHTKTDIHEIKPILAFCTPLVIGAALGYFSNGYDKTFLAKMGDDIEFGYYCVGASIASYLSLFTSSLSSTFQPDIYEAIINNRKRKLYRVALLRWLLTFIIVAVFVLLCPIIIRILTAGKYMQSTGYARVFACSCLVSSIYYIINDYTIARGLPSFYFYTTVIGSILIVVLIPLLVKWFGYYGGALSTIFSFLILSLVNLFLLWIHSISDRIRGSVNSR